MNRGVFVTGTDTGCGKTHASVALIRALRARALRVTGFKPVAAGADWCDGELRNDDASALLAASGLDLPYATVNPYCFAPAIAPHLAAAEERVTVSPGPINAAFAKLCGASDFVVVEGAGGWRVPLGPDLDIQRLALVLGLPVILVVGLRLGCLNHAVLSEQAIKASGAVFLGWVGSQVDPEMPRLRQNIATLESILPVPCLGILPHVDAAGAADCASPIAIDAVLGL